MIKIRTDGTRVLYFVTIVGLGGILGLLAMSMLAAFFIVFVYGG